MSSDPWGIDRAYCDGLWPPAPHDIRKAILAAMGADEATPAPDQGPSVRVVAPGAPIAWDAPGELHLEQGGVVAVRGALPPDLPLGYHRFHPHDRPGTIWLIVSPGQCRPPDHRTWGWSAQLYALRSAESWGIGDLADLRRLGRWSGGQGAGLVLVCPLQAAAPVVPQQASPYYPTSRRFLNPLYLRVEEVPGADRAGPALERAAQAGRELNRRRRIDRDDVFRLKQAALQLLWSRFPGSADFERFCQQRGAELQQFATYCALAVRFGADWRAWPVPYRVPGSRAVRRFADERRYEIRYHQWLQWLLDEQLRRAAESLPLVSDLPVGFDPTGADAWLWQDLLATGCSVGAPPDEFNKLGQDWGLPPFVPHKLRAAGYQPLAQTIRAVLRHARGLRIDHVMGLSRLYWIPQGFGPTRGAYVRYHEAETLAVVALESHRAGAFVVGEDLGTVEPAMRVELRQREILSYRVLWFEQQPAAELPPLAMAAATTHDLPTVAGVWSGQDLHAQKQLGLVPSDTPDRLRELHRRRLPELADAAPVSSVVEGTYRLLGQAPSQIRIAAPEDALEVPERPNMPGTIDQWPNWSLALPGGLEALERSALGARISELLSHRGGSHPAAGTAAAPPTRADP